MSAVYCVADIDGLRILAGSALSTIRMTAIGQLSLTRGTHGRPVQAVTTRSSRFGSTTWEVSPDTLASRHRTCSVDTAIIMS
jgi:hypothetical protein